MRRVMVILSGMMIAATARVHALDWNVFSINQNPVPATAVVSFSIGYPNGWQAMQNSSWRQDIYNDIVTPLPGCGIICNFWQHPSSANLTNWTNFVIFRSSGKTARDAAESLARNMRDYTEKSLSPVKTAAGDSGWLLESKCDFKIGEPIGGPISPGKFNRNGLTVQLIPADSRFTVEKEIDHEYFFHSGSKGSIRIEIMTPAWNQALRSELDKLVLQTLRFTDS